MQAREQTTTWLRWWWRCGIDRIDLAVRLPSGAWVTHADRALPATALLAWARAMNTRRADVYVRPARGHRWPHLFLDDLPPSTAWQVSSRHRAAIVRTSIHGGCHLHLALDRPCTEAERGSLQRHLAAEHGADPAACAGCQFQRLPGFRNWKRGGNWINLVAIQGGDRPPLAVAALLDGDDEPARATLLGAEPRSGTRIDRSPSAKDWAAVCARLERGDDQAAIITDLALACLSRRANDATRYAALTVTRAVDHIRRRRTT